MATLDEMRLMFSVEKPKNLEVCPDCKGERMVWKIGPNGIEIKVDCSTCNGTGNKEVATDIVVVNVKSKNKKEKIKKKQPISPASHMAEKKFVECRVCRGIGRNLKVDISHPNSLDVCSNCNGTGKTEVVEMELFDAPLIDENYDEIAPEKHCYWCGGTGIVEEENGAKPCPKCKPPKVKEDENELELPDYIKGNVNINNNVATGVCNICGGSGGFVDVNGDYERCTMCNGTGKVKRKANKHEESRNNVAKRDGRYTISQNGKDALINFGRYKGKRLTDIIASGNIDYLNWIIRESFPDDLKDVCRYKLRENNKITKRR